MYTQSHNYLFYNSRHYNYCIYLVTIITGCTFLVSLTSLARHLVKVVSHSASVVSAAVDAMADGRTRPSVNRTSRINELIAIDMMTGQTTNRPHLTTARRLNRPLYRPGLTTLTNNMASDHGVRKLAMCWHARTAWLMVIKCQLVRRPTNSVMTALDCSVSSSGTVS